MHVLKDNILDIFNEISNVPSRKSKEEQLWVAGCSISAGEEVSAHSAYGNLLSSKLNKPITTIAEGGSSNRFQASKILKCDLNKNDILFWGLTSFQRTPLYGIMDLPQEDKDLNKNMYHVNSYTYENKLTKNIIDQYIPIELIDSNHMIYESISAIQEVVNICNKIGVILVIGGLLVDRMADKFCEFFPNYTNFNNGKYLDVGTDGFHPGPKQHQLYADLFYKSYINNPNNNFG